MIEKIEKALAIIREELSRANNPLVLWSAGKDSMLMLALIYEIARDISVVYFEGFPSPTKHDFAYRMLKEWCLSYGRIMPAFRDVVEKDGHIEIIEAYQPQKDVWLYFPIEAEPDHVPGPESYCAIEKLNELTSPTPCDFDMIFIGHRADDVDPVHGAIPLVDFVSEHNGVRFVYPLKDFTEKDVWEASALLNVPQNTRRYIFEDMKYNADYWPICVRCLEPADGDTVICPKINEPVFALHKFINPEARREQWRQRFVNIEKINEAA